MKGKYKVEVLKECVVNVNGKAGSITTGEHSLPLDVCHRLITKGYAKAIDKLPELQKK